MREKKEVMEKVLGTAGHGRCGCRQFTDNGNAMSGYRTKGGELKGFPEF
jgi:hypothetical protein